MSLLHRKSSMVLFALEQAIGELVLDNEIIDIPDSIIQEISERETSKGRSFDPSQIKDVVEATYLDELFRIAINASKDNSKHNFIKYLYSLFHTFEIYLIRNAVSHPNRQFLDYYWYRLAALATDPVIDILNLTKVKNAFVSAQEGILDDPPEEWINRIIWQTPNNLPKNFEHAITGLIGRQKESKQLESFILNPRINTVALVAPGGLGKTALALDLLQNWVHSPNTLKHLDGVIFITLKTEKLTANGIQTLSAIQTLDELKSKIIESFNEIFDDEETDFSECLKNNEEKHILLCIDNLETILRDEQEIFEEFNNSLPLNWKVLITSRVTVENTKTLSLQPLDHKNGEILARKYQQSKGMVALDHHTYSEIAEKCFFNPLAIRLTIDLINLGKDIPTSVNHAQKSIGEFSYNNLIESLTELSIQILEAIFVETNSTRASLCNLLEKNLDEISDSIGELSRTSLIVKSSKDDVEIYSLNDSIKELLLVSPRNMLTRGLVQNKILEQKTKVREIDFHQEKSQFPIWHRDYIPVDTPEALKILVKEGNKIVNRKHLTDYSLLTDSFRRLKDQEMVFSEYPIFHKVMAKILGKLKDTTGQEKSILKGLALSPEDPSIIYMLARYYADQGDYEKSSTQYEKLIDLEWIKTDDTNISFSKSIYNGYFLSLIYGKKSDLVLEKTKTWKEQGPFIPLIGVYRATAWKRIVETYAPDQVKEIEAALNSALKIFDDVFRNYGYFNEACKQATKVFEEVLFYANNNLSNKHKISEFLDIIYKHFLAVSENHVTYNWSELLNKFCILELKDNPFNQRNNFQSKKIDIINKFVNGVQDGSYKFVRITKKNEYTLFAVDCNDVPYFLHQNQFNGPCSWHTLSTNDILKVLPSPPDPKQHAIKVKIGYST